MIEYFLWFFFWGYNFCCIEGWRISKSHWWNRLLCRNGFSLPHPLVCFFIEGEHVYNKIPVHSGDKGERQKIRKKLNTTSKWKYRSRAVVTLCQCVVINVTAYYVLPFHGLVHGIHAHSDRHSTSRHSKARFPTSKAIYSSIETSIRNPTAAEYLACEDSFSSRW